MHAYESTPCPRQCRTCRCMPNGFDASMLSVLSGLNNFRLFGLSFFVQAEDGIRDLTVTGVQTGALPICIGRPAQLTVRPQDCCVTKAANRFTIIGTAAVLLCDYIGDPMRLLRGAVVSARTHVSGV